MAIGRFYRPPQGNLHGCIEILDNILSTVVPTVDQVICMGDFNIDMLKSNNLLASCFKSFNFWQVTDDPTRISPSGSATLLDLIFVSNREIVENSGCLNVDHISDHKLTFTNIIGSVHKFKQKFITVRNLKNLDNDQFLKDLQSVSFHHIFRSRDVNQKVILLNNIILDLFNKHAPLRTVRISKPKAPWLTDNVRGLMKNRDIALRKFRQSKCPNDFSFYKQLRNLTLSAIRAAKKEYITLVNSGGDSRRIWKVLGDFNVRNNPVKTIPTGLYTPDAINDFFSSMFSTHTDPEIVEYYDTNEFTANSSFTFRMLTVREIHEIIHSMKSNATGLDNINAVLIKHCSPVIDPVITNIVNVCIETGCFPQSWKTSIIHPPSKTNKITSLCGLIPREYTSYDVILEKCVCVCVYMYAYMGTW